MKMIDHSCIGSISVMYVLQLKKIPFLVLGTLLTMTVNGAFLEQRKSKLTIVLFGLGVMINLIPAITGAFFNSLITSR